LVRRRKTMLIHISNAENKKAAQGGPFVDMVEAAGIEPASEDATSLALHA
jgi:hypothetical protein